MSKLITILFKYRRYLIPKLLKFLFILPAFTISLGFSQEFCGFDYIHSQMKEDGICIIYDILGNEKIRIYLSKNTQRVNTLLNGMRTGVYMCKFLVDGKFCW